jgi:hypothetical protein
MQSIFRPKFERTEMSHAIKICVSARELVVAQEPASARQVNTHFAPIKLQIPIGVVRPRVTAAPVEGVFVSTSDVSVRRLQHVEVDTLVVVRITACPKVANAVILAVGNRANLVTVVVMMGVNLNVVQLGQEVLVQCPILLCMKIIFILMRMLAVVMLKVVVVLILITVVRVVTAMTREE